MLMTGRGLSATTHYFFAFDATDQVWNGSAFVAFVNASYAIYKIAATETGATGRYKATAPTGTVRFELRRQVGSLATDVVTSEGDAVEGTDGTVVTSTPGGTNTYEFDTAGQDIDD